MSGDHVASPLDYVTTNAERQVLSWLDYVTLALGNHQHFWPDVKQTWRTHHKDAINSAKKAKAFWREGNVLDAKLEFERALAHSAFADHFLQDSFSAGHVGFYRINSLQNPSLTIHDYWSKVGRWFRGKSISDESVDPFMDKDTRIESIRKGLEQCTTPNTLVTRDGGKKIEKEHSACDTVVWYAYGDRELNKQTAVTQSDQRSAIASYGNEINKLKIL